jgi:hypothetical protein
MKNGAIRITDVENGYLVTIEKYFPIKADGDEGLLGFLKGHRPEGVARQLVCKSWPEVLSTLAALDDSMTRAGL